MTGLDQAFVLAQDGGDAGGPLAIVVLLVQLAVIVAFIAGMWKTFEKAGKPGWAAIVPVYNLITLAEVAGKPSWWGLLCLIPCVNIVVLILLSIDVAKNFGKGGGFGVGLALLAPIFYPLLGFSDAKYRKPRN